MVTVVEDVDKEGLLEHLAVESEAKELRWVKDKCARPTGLDARLASAKRLREKGNLAYDRSEWDAAVWLYLAALHHVCLLYTSPSPRDATLSRMPSSA